MYRCVWWSTWFVYFFQYLVFFCVWNYVLISYIFEPLSIANVLRFLRFANQVSDDFFFRCDTIVGWVLRFPSLLGYHILSLNGAIFEISFRPGTNKNEDFWQKTWTGAFAWSLGWLEPHLYPFTRPGKRLQFAIGNHHAINGKINYKSFLIFFNGKINYKFYKSPFSIANCKRLPGRVHLARQVEPTIGRIRLAGDVPARHDDGGAVQGHCAEVAFGAGAATWRCGGIPGLVN